MRGARIEDMGGEPGEMVGSTRRGYLCSLHSTDVLCMTPEPRTGDLIVGYKGLHAHLLF